MSARVLAPPCQPADISLRQSAIHSSQLLTRPTSFQQAISLALSPRDCDISRCNEQGHAQEWCAVVGAHVRRECVVVRTQTTSFELFLRVYPLATSPAHDGRARGAGVRCRLLPPSRPSPHQYRLPPHLAPLDASAAFFFILEANCIAAAVPDATSSEGISEGGARCWPGSSVW